MSATPTNEEEVEIPSEEGVGQHLRKVREALDLSRGEVAAGLYLKESIVAALEDDDRDALPSPVFVQGYIRKYARLLNIPEEPLLEEYSQQIAPHKRGKKREGPLAGSPIKPEISSKHAVVRLITWAIVLGLLALLFIWWQGDMQWPMGQSEQQSATSQDNKPEYSFAPEVVKPDAASFSEEEAPTALKQVTMPEAEAQLESVALDEQQVERIQDEAAVGNLPIEMTENEPANDEAPLVSEAVEAAPGTETTAAGESGTAQDLNALAESASEPSSVTGDSSVDTTEQKLLTPVDYANSIVIEFSEACWTEIRGANNSYKLLGNMQEGERRVLGGEPPYTFLLGNSQAVTLTIKGQRFDIEAHSRANIARFTLQAEDISTL